MNGRLIELYKDTQLSKRQLAFALGLPYSTVNMLLNEKTCINQCSAATVARIAAYFGVEMSSLLDPFPIMDCVEGNYKEYHYKWKHRRDHMEIIYTKDGEEYRVEISDELCLPARRKEYDAISELLLETALEDVGFDALADTYMEALHEEGH